MTPHHDQSVDDTFDDPTDELDERDDPTDDEFDDEFDDDLAFAPSARQGIGRLTTGLLVGIALVAAFGGGVWAQKQQDTGASGGPSMAAVAGRAAGGFGAAGGGPPGAVADPTSGGTGSSGAGANAATTPAVIGTVVKVAGDVVTVRNFAGKTVEVTVPDGVAVTKSEALATDDLEKGVSVTVTGTTDADGVVTATGVTAR